MAIEIVERPIPVISLKDFKLRRNDIKAQIVAAARQLGFFVLVDHPIGEDIIAEQITASETYFALDKQMLKNNYGFNREEKTGFESLNQRQPSTGLIDQKESLWLKTSSSYGWPSKEDAGDYSEKTEQFMLKCHSLSMDILDMLEEDLGFSQGTFRKAHNINDRASLTILRSLHYMPKPATNEEYWRCGSHADMSLLSLLFQKEGQGGLQICPGRDAITDWGMGDKWTEVPAKQYWSDDRYKSIWHQVAAKNEAEDARFSIAYFNNASSDTIIGGEGKYPARTAHELIEDR
ncbi:MAG: hypothetical protein CYPHOPRED_004479, partial [Cyphobasidiales sp. Tagirdzhanova-0007]